MIDAIWTPGGARRPPAACRRPRRSAGVRPSRRARAGAAGEAVRRTPASGGPSAVGVASARRARLGGRLGR